jgi:S-adenosylmethionine decarboxylase
MSYQPGLHIIAELSVANTALLNKFEPAKLFIDQTVSNFHLQKLGEVYHNFSPAGFTGVVCLSESHLSLHSWPEYNRLHMDVYLSNFSRNNDDTTKAIFENILDFFDGRVIHQQIVKR